MVTVNAIQRETDADVSHKLAKYASVCGRFQYYENPKATATATVRATTKLNLNVRLFCKRPKHIHINSRKQERNAKTHIELQRLHIYTHILCVCRVLYYDT